MLYTRISLFRPTSRNELRKQTVIKKGKEHVLCSAFFKYEAKLIVTGSLQCLCVKNICTKTARHFKMLVGISASAWSHRLSTIQHRIPCIWSIQLNFGFYFTS